MHGTCIKIIQISLLSDNKKSHYIYGIFYKFWSIPKNISLYINRSEVCFEQTVQSAVQHTLYIEWKFCVCLFVCEFLEQIVSNAGHHYGTRCSSNLSFTDEGKEELDATITVYW
jgi:hypothetical protein